MALFFLVHLDVVLMFKMFAYIADCLQRHEMKPTDFLITITPLTADAEAMFKIQWCAESDGLQMTTKPATAFYDGYLYGVRFRIASMPK